jgi:hypothetical protein
MKLLGGLLALIIVAAGATYYLGLWSLDTGPKGAQTAEDCHQAMVVAGAAGDPTDVACDWKKILAASPGAALNGRYDAASTGVSGRMVVMEAAGKPARIAISTASQSSEHTCTAALAAERSGDTLVATPAEAPGCEVRVASSQTPNVVTVTATEACSYFCGMRLGLSGDYKLAD